MPSASIGTSAPTTAELLADSAAATAVERALAEALGVLG